MLTVERDATAALRAERAQVVTALRVRPACRPDRNNAIKARVLRQVLVELLLA
jgi:hypothetical protein